MVPIPQKRAAEEAEDLDTKRQKVEDEAEDLVEIGDDSEMGELEDVDEEALQQLLGNMGPSFDKADFEDVEITDDQLEKFNTAFEEFMVTLEETNENPMVMGKPVAIRPIPSTVEEFEEKLPYINLPKAVIEFSETVREAIDKSGESINEEMATADSPKNDEDNSKFDEQVEKWHRQMEDAQIATFNQYLGDLEEAVKEEGDKKDLWAKFIVFTDSVFDEDVHQLFFAEEAKAGVLPLVARLEKVWNTLAALKDEEIGTTQKLRKDTSNMIANMEAALQRGDFGFKPEDEEEEEEEEDEKEEVPENPHKETTFCPKLF